MATLEEKKEKSTKARGQRRYRKMTDAEIAEQQKANLDSNVQKLENDIQQGLVQQQQIGSQQTQMPRVAGVPSFTTQEDIAANNALNESMGKLTDTVGGAVVPAANEINLTNPAKSTETTSPWEQMLAERRESLKKEKTDAQTMQKYYALSDVLKTLGQMGGAAIGGAIGGDALAGANVPEYKRSQGYIDAFEKAKSASDALRRLDDAEFQLKYNRMEKDNERAYNEAREKANRDYQAQQNELSRQFQAEQARITREWNKAIADKDFERQAALKKEMAKIEQDYKLQYQKINNEHEAAIKAISKEIVSMQTSGTGKATGVPVGFADGSGMSIPKPYYDSMVRFFIGEDRGDGNKITDKNVDTFIKNNPEKVKEYLKRFSVETESSAGSDEFVPNQTSGYFFYNPFTGTTTKSETDAYFTHPLGGAFIDAYHNRSQTKEAQQTNAADQKKNEEATVSAKDKWADVKRK